MSHSLKKSPGIKYGRDPRECSTLVHIMAPLVPLGQISNHYLYNHHKIMLIIISLLLLAFLAGTAEKF